MIFIIGCGDIGCQVASHYLKNDVPVTGLVQRTTSAERLRNLGVHPIQKDLDSPLFPPLPTCGCRLFYFAPPPPSGRTDPRIHRVITSFNEGGNPQRIVYISTTSVYGDCKGDWVDESRPIAPTADRAYRRQDAENQLRAWSRSSGGELIILRVAGIYGPGKLPLKRLKKHLPLVKESEAPYTNRIHSHDLTQVCIAAMERGRSGEIINVSDGHPGTMTDYFNRVADLVDLPRPPTISLVAAEEQLSAGMLSYMRESRRLSNQKMKEQLGVELRYPTLAEGLPACLEHQHTIKEQEPV